MRDYYNNSDGYCHANGGGLFYKEEFTVNSNGKTMKVTNWFDSVTREFRQECHEELDLEVE